MIHKTAIIHPKAELGKDCDIGPYVIIGEHVKMGKGVQVMPHAVIDGWTTIGEGCKIFPHAVIGMITQDRKNNGGRSYVLTGKNTTLREFVTIHMATPEEGKTVVGDNCLLLAYCHVAHECILGNGIIMSNAVNLGGHVVVQDNAIIGGMTGVHQFCRVGKYSFTGACSKISQDVPPYMLGEGNPLKIYSPNVVGLERNNFSDETRDALKKAYKLLYISGLNVSQAIEKIKQDLPQIQEIQELLTFIAESERGITK